MPFLGSPAITGNREEGGRAGGERCGIRQRPGLSAQADPRTARALVDTTPVPDGGTEHGVVWEAKPAGIQPHDARGGPGSAPDVQRGARAGYLRCALHLKGSEGQSESALALDPLAPAQTRQRRAIRCSQRRKRIPPTPQPGACRWERSPPGGGNSPASGAPWRAGLGVAGGAGLPSTRSLLAPFQQAPDGRAPHAGLGAGGRGRTDKDKRGEWIPVSASSTSA